MNEIDIKNFSTKYSDIEHCPVRNILSHISSKWTILVLLITNSAEIIRFNQISKCLPDISPKVLASTLKSLENDGLIKRKVFPEVPPRVEYSLTDIGASLIPLLHDLSRWAADNYNVITQHRLKMQQKQN